MKIINIVPGFGGSFYCGNCLRDSAYAQSLQANGHETLTLPVYLPLTAKNMQHSNHIPVFYGAVSIYLRQRYTFLRKMPVWMENFFNAPVFLKMAAKKAGSTRSHGMEEMTISMLKGSQGYQKQELQQLVDFLKHREKPDVVHLSNALLLGLAKQIKEELKVPVVCSLQDEDVWIDDMDENYRKKMWNLLQEKSDDVDAFIAVSNYYAKLMQDKMHIPDDKLHTVHIGIDPGKYTFHPPAFNPPTIGYLSRMNEHNGMDIVVDAFILLKKNPLFKTLKLKLSGGMTGDDKPYINKQLNKLKHKNLLHDLLFIKEFESENLSDFFKELTLLTVPVLKGEAFGLYQLEALACGVPLVQPNLGAFPEVIQATQGGITYEPNTPEALAAKWTELLSHPEKLKKISETGHRAVVEKFNSKLLIEKMSKIYEEVTQKNDQKNLVVRSLKTTNNG